jgi:ubiquinone biosynthesis protein UbiJ
MTCVVAGTASRRKTASRSATASRKDLVSRLTEAGEDTLQRLTDLPGGQRAVSAFNDLRNRVDDLSKKVRGIDALEERISKLEKEVASLKRGSTSRRSPTRKSSAT